MSDIYDYCIIGAIIIAIIVLGVGLYRADVAEQKEWDAFAATHNCRIVRTEKASTDTAVLSNGKVGVIITPEKNTFACDDGREYTR